VQVLPRPQQSCTAESLFLQACMVSLELLRFREEALAS